MLTDIEIAQAAQPLDISAVAEKAGVASEYLECYGRTKAKVDYNLLRDKDYQPGKLILVTAINPRQLAKVRPPQRWVSPMRFPRWARIPWSRCASPRSGPSLA